MVRLPQVETEIKPFWEGNTVGGADVVIRIRGEEHPGGSLICDFNQDLYGIPCSVDWDSFYMEDEAGELGYTADDERIQHQLLRSITAGRDTKGTITITYRNKFLPARPNPVMDMGQEAGGVSGSGENWMPRLTQEEYELDMKISKDGLPDGAKVLWSYGEEHISRTMKKADLQETFYYFGLAKGVENKNFGYYWFDREGFDASEIAVWTSEVFLKMADFFRDDNEAYKIFARARQCRKSGGTALKRSYSYIYDPDALPTMTELKFLFPHEMVHNWVTLLDEPFGTCTWYVEGMAEFYCLVLPWRFGLASREELLEQLNERAEQYYENPCAAYPANELGDLLFKDKEATTVPYGRGFFYLMAIDSRIREKTGGSRSLDDVMFAILERTKAGEVLQNEAWLQELSKVLDGDVKEEFEAMMKGAVISPIISCFDGADIEIIKKEGISRRDGNPCVTYEFR